MSEEENKPYEDKALKPTEPVSEKAIAKSAAPEEGETPGITTDIQAISPDVKRQIQAFMAMFQSQIRMPTNPLFDKFTEAHIDKYLDYVQRDDDNAYELKKSNRWFYLGYFVLALVVLGAAIVYLLPRDKDFLEAVIRILVVLAGGIGAGYGLKSRKEE
jgi:hypothetical protein